ncbi:MAG: MFS transporter [Bradyrhizobiaceae bacterium]|nr:MAG: MFS transporter [Bradyrhizobiaceae bacterium]
MNKPVILSEDTLAAPVIADDDSVPKVPASMVPAMTVLGAISLSHFLNDLMQSLIPSVYPILKENYALDFSQIGMITFAFMMTSSLLQPVVGLYTDRKPLPYSLSLGMSSTFAGLILLSFASHYSLIIAAAALVGLGSAIFHPESSRIARIASGGQYGLAQSVFQVGGNFGQALGPVLAALIVVPFGQRSIAWFSLVAALAIVLLWRIGAWYKPRIVPRPAKKAERGSDALPTARVAFALAVLVVLLFSKAFYLSGINSFYTFFLIHKFGVSTQTAQLYLFVFLAASACGTFFGGPLGDRFGRKYVIWFSILGVLPFTLVLPYANIYWTLVLSILIGFILSSAMPQIIVYSQELMPHRLGMISGIFFGLVFGVGGIGAAVLGTVADHAGIDFVYWVCSFLPAIGLVAVLLPNLKRVKS